jgi:hypothetical protein
LSKQVSDAISQKEKTEALLKKCEEESIQYQKLIKQDKELFQVEIASLNQKIEVTKRKNENVTASHIKKLTKAKADRRKFEVTACSYRPQSLNFLSSKSKRRL